MQAFYLTVSLVGLKGYEGGVDTVSYYLQSIT